MATAQPILDSHRVAIPNPDQLLCPGARLTERDLAQYHERIAWERLEEMEPGS
ncbi:MAG: hypothetical protein J2P45_31995 [Candidatus Dormibacteraeota bacterium]|nr:hypothetical protein [Candidatus Dormibacteraeota bacterium]